jgi:hypothetical protein
MNKRSSILLKRFEGRKDLGKEGLFETFFKPIGLDKKDVLECLDEIELGYEIPPGVLRPEDSMSKLNERVTTRNPIEWFLWVGRNEFAGDDLLDELNRRLRKYGTFDDWGKTIQTFGDLVKAWCGKRPDAIE